MGSSGGLLCLLPPDSRNIIRTQRVWGKSFAKLNFCANLSCALKTRFGALESSSLVRDFIRTKQRAKRTYTVERRQCVVK